MKKKIVCILLVLVMLLPLGAMADSSGNAFTPTLIPVANYSVSDWMSDETSRCLFAILGILEVTNAMPNYSDKYEIDIGIKGTFIAANNNKTGIALLYPVKEKSSGSELYICMQFDGTTGEANYDVFTVSSSEAKEAMQNNFSPVYECDLATMSAVASQLLDAVNS